MIFLILIVIIILASFVFSVKGKKIRKDRIHKLIYLFLGFLCFFLLIRIAPPLFAVMTSVFIVVIPHVNKALKILSFAVMFKGIIQNFKRTVPNERSPSNYSDSVTYEDALDILGVDKESTKAQINKAYRAKMAKNHPDKGGSNYIASKLTNARDVLLKRKK
jgi:DMSO/TMAO reductase YedYZ heme-binding membrane subunit